MRFTASFRICLLVLVATVTSAVGTATAGPIISTPRGLNPGDHFRIAFVTTDTSTATSSDISTYDNFVTMQADGATYNGDIITWLAIGSTGSVSAIAHIGVTNDPVFLVDGTEVTNTDSTSGLWSGSLLHGINLDISSTPQNVAVWTGTFAAGLPEYYYGYHFLGSSQPVTGLTDYPVATPSGWVAENLTPYPSQTFNIYGISTDLVATSSVPEPSTAMLAGLGVIGVAIHTCQRRRVSAATIV